MKEIPRYIHMLHVEQKDLERVRGIVDEVLPNPCEVKSLGRGMYNLLFYASELEYDTIAAEVDVTA